MGVVWAAFRKFDVDGNGSIDVKELAKVLGDEDLKEQMHLSGEPGRLEEVFKEIDVNGDGLIDFEEFFAMVRQAEDDARETVFKKRTNATEESPRPPGPGSISARSAKSRKSEPREMDFSPVKSCPSPGDRGPSRSPRRSRGKKDTSERGSPRNPAKANSNR